MTGLSGLFVACVLLVSATAAPTGDSNNDNTCVDSFLSVAGGSYSCDLLINNSRTDFLGVYQQMSYCDPPTDCCYTCSILKKRLQTTTTTTTTTTEAPSESKDVEDNTGASSKSDEVPYKVEINGQDSGQSVKDPTYIRSTQDNGKVDDIKVDLRVVMANVPLDIKDDIDIELIIGRKKPSQ